MTTTQRAKPVRTRAETIARALARTGPYRVVGPDRRTLVHELRVLLGVTPVRRRFKVLHGLDVLPESIAQ